MNKPLAGKVALITGGARGLGEATALAMAEQGADVAITYVQSTDRAEAVAEKIRALGVRSIAFKADQANRAQTKKLIEDVIDNFGKLDILVNNASIDQYGLVNDPEADQEAFDRFWAVTVTGLRDTVRAASRVISENGRIIMIGSPLGIRASGPGISDNAASKAAIDGYSRGVARDLASRGVTVNVVHAGLMPTELTAGNTEALKPVLQLMCFPRFARLEEVVAPILFLASPAASFITGSSIEANGGFNA